MADLDQISAMIGGLQTDVRRLVEWTDRHERADQRRFEELAERIDSKVTQHGDRMTAIEISDAETRGSLKAAGLVGGLVSAVVAAAYHLIGAWRGL